MKCFVCGQKIVGDGVILNVDGDIACDEKCQEQHKKDLHELGEACQTEQGFLNWLGFNPDGTVRSQS